MLAAAEELFRARGYEGVGVAEVLEAAAAPRGSLYFHFPGGKEQIGVEAVKRVGQAAVDGFRALGESGVDLNQFVERVFKSTAKTVKERGYNASCPIFAIATEMSDANPKLMAAVREVFASWESEIAAAAVARGMSAKNAAEFASAMVTAIGGAMVVSKAQRSTAPHHNAAKALKALGAVLMAP